MDKTNLYSASKAKEDFENRQSQKSDFVDDEKMILLLSAIKDHIQSLKIGSESAHFGYPQFDWPRHLSDGEKEFLGELGYKVTWENGVVGKDAHWKITW